jgi:MoxR-like ATPase
MTQNAAARPLFVGFGRTPRVAAPWRTEAQDSAEAAALIAAGRLDDPADYEADPGLRDAMNVALLLGRPLLLTGRPGTGKSQFADRVAWEFGLAPVLRFESKSVSEAQDLFYRFDMVGRLAAAQPGSGMSAAVHDHLYLAAMGKAVLYSRPWPAGGRHGLKLDPPHPAPAEGRASVVLIDEIDKASRDFPNDLLNELERFGFSVPELPGQPRFEAARTPATRPVVVITSNSERELPEPFLRRCICYHIPPPDTDRLRRIVAGKLFRGGSGSDAAELPTLFHQLVQCFVDYRDQGSKRAAFTPGTSELLDLARVVAADPEVRADEPVAAEANAVALRRAAAAVAKGRDDAEVFGQHLDQWQSRR